MCVSYHHRSAALQCGAGKPKIMKYEVFPSRHHDDGNDDKGDRNNYSNNNDMIIMASNMVDHINGHNYD